MENTKGGKFEKGIVAVNHYLLKYLVVVLTICIVLGAVHLTYIIIKDLMEPPYAMIEVSALLEIFSLALIILVGYELIKSFSIIISSEKIPVTPILQIGLTAVANKIITLDIKHIDVGYLYGIAALALALSVSLFLVNFNRGAGMEDGKN